MGNYFAEERNIELSLLYYLTSEINNDWSNITIVKTQKQVYAKNTNLPIICVRLADTVSVRLEVGSDTLDNRHLVVIDIYARSNGQRLDLKSYIKDKLKSGWIHYDHSHVPGDKSVLDRTPNGRDYVVGFLMDAPVSFADIVDIKDKFRHTISCRVRKSS